MEQKPKPLASPLTSAAPRRRKRLMVALSVLIAAAFVLVAVTHNVPVDLSADDRAYIERLVAASGHSRLVANAAVSRPFTEQIAIIAEVQAAVLAAAPIDEPIPFDRQREPKDLFELGFGECFDRSRVIEKALTYVGLKNRHAAVYSTAETGAPIAYLASQVPSHAVTEVLTEKGWMLVDSNAPWIGLTQDLTVVSLDDLQETPEIHHASWHALAKQAIDDIFKSDFTYMIGLYSRHGRFYPPYDFVPDVNFVQLSSNLVE